MRVENNILAILDRSVCSGCTMVLPPEQFDRITYAAIAKVIEAAGGKWNKRARAHLFEFEAAEAIDPILITGKVYRKKQELSQFYTPPDIARAVVEIAKIESGEIVLEPSAGRGSLAAIALLRGALVDCFDIDARNVEILCSTPYRQVVHGDFMLAIPDPQYDVILMNPPFAQQADIKHVRHAIDFLKPSGRLVAIMSASVLSRQNRLAEDFRLLMAAHHATSRVLPPDAFQASGTNVNTVVVSFGAVP